MIDSTLPFGIQLTPLNMHRDGRGWPSEIYRRNQPVGVEPFQWNLTDPVSFLEPTMNTEVRDGF